MWRIVAGAAILAGLLLPAVATPVAKAAGNIYYVSKTGNNADGRSWTTAWNELNQINWNVIGPGDTILLDGGSSDCTYPVAVTSDSNMPRSLSGGDCGMTYLTTLTVGRSGDVGNPITIKVAQDAGRNGTVRIFGGRSTPLPYCGQSGYVWQNATQYGIYVGSYAHIVIDGGKWSGIMVYGHNQDGIRAASSQDITFRNMEIFDNGTSGPDQPGVDFVGTGLHFDGLIVHDNGQDAFQTGGPVGDISWTRCWLYNRRPHPTQNDVFNSCTHSDGIQIWGGGDQYNFLIQDCVIGPGLMQCLLLGGYTDTAHDATINNVTIRNTLLYTDINTQLGNACIMSEGGNGNTDPQNWLVENVTSWRKDTNSKWHNWFVTGAGHVIRNSIFHGSNITTYNLDEPLSTEGNVQWQTTGATMGQNLDPMFVDPSGEDFALRPESACAGKGSSITSASQLLGRTAPPASPTPTASLVPTRTPTVTPVSPAATATVNPSEFIIDNADIGFTASSSQDAWTEYVEVGGQHFGGSHFYNHLLGTGQDTATWSFIAPRPGRYEVYAWWWAGDWRPSNVPYTVNHSSGPTTVRVNQQTNGGQWNLLGTFDFEASGSVVVSDDATAGQDVVADAIRLVYLGSSPSVTSTPTPAVPTSSPTPAGGETTVTLQQGNGGYVGVADTYLDQYNATSNYSWADSLKVGYKQTTAGLLSYDVSSIPAGASINSAQLQVYATGWGGSNIELGAHAVVRGMAAGQATWNQASSGQAWGLPGCNDTSTDRRGTAESTLTTSGVNKWYSFDIRSVVQSWVDGTLANNGVLLRQTTPAAYSFSFAGGEKADGSLRPKLVVTYQGGKSPLPTATPTATATGAGIPTETATPTGTSTATATATSTATQTSVATLTSTPLGGETMVTLQQGNGGYAGAEDTYLDRYNAGSNYAWADSLKVGYKQTLAGLLQLDVSSIPQGASISSAELQVYAMGWGGANIGIGAYALLRNADSGQATWNQASTGQAWGVPGCNDANTDRHGTAESTVATSGINKWYSFDITSLVQQWVSGAFDNNGVLLRQTTTAAYAFLFASSERTDGSLRPRLVVTYSGGQAVEPTSTPTATAPASVTPAATASASATPTATPTAMASATPTATASASATPTATTTATASVATATPTATLTAVATPTAGGVETTVTFRQENTGYRGAEDAWICSDTASTNYGAADSLRVGYRQKYASLLRFELTSIPAGSTVVAAKLYVWAMGWSGANLSIGAYAILRDAKYGEATWSQASAGNPWGLAGCNDLVTDRRGTAESTLTTAGVRKWYAFDLGSLVQEWVSGSLANEGVLLRQSVPSDRSILFASAENYTVANRPQLVVTYR